MAKMIHLHRALRHSVFTLALVCIFLNPGCGPRGDEQRHADQHNAKSEYETAKKEKLERIASFERQHGCVYFSPESVPKKAYTYQIQQFFSVNSSSPIAFEAFINDVFEQDGQIYVEAICSLTDYLFFTKEEGIILKLAISREQANQLADHTSEEQTPGFYFFEEPEFILIANVEGISRQKLYLIDASGYAEDVELEHDDSIRRVVTGTLRAIVPINSENSVKNQ